MHSSFSKIFWGLLLAEFHFRIHGIDLLPDFIGYLLLALGCSGLHDESSNFSTAQLLSWLAFLLSITIIALGRTFPTFLPLLSLCLDTLLICFILGGIKDFCNTREDTKLALTAVRRRNTYLSVFALSLIELLLMKAGSEFAKPLFVFLFIWSLITMFLILYFIKRVQADLIEENP